MRKVLILIAFWMVCSTIVFSASCTESVNGVGGADFVFADDYCLRPLSEVQSFIQENRHLPEIQSAVEMQQNGVSVNELQFQLLQKIEELTLYIIEQDKQIQELQQKVEHLEQ